MCIGFTWHDLRNHNVSHYVPSALFAGQHPASVAFGIDHDALHQVLCLIYVGEAPLLSSMSSFFPTNR